MKEATDFYYAGEYSVDLGITQCHVNTSGLLEEQFLADQSIDEIYVRGNDTPYLVGTSRKPLVIELEFCFDEAYDEDAVRAVARLFANQTYYREFYTTLNTSRRWRCMYTGSPTLLHNSLSNGYVKMQLRCDSAYSYSPQYLSSEIKTSTQDICATGTNSTGIIATSHSLSTGSYIYNINRDAIRAVTIVDADTLGIATAVTSQTVGDVIDKYPATGGTTSTTFSNDGDKSLKPEIEFRKIGSGSIQVVNTTNGNQELVFDSLVSGEYLYIDCKNEIVLSDQTGVYRYSNMSSTSEFLELLYGENILELTGNFTMQMRYYYELLNG